ncbi:glucan endo-1,3-beta-glucosidase 3-like [Aristolochia californica]|uniref:glucan endo-1,3-beta-glucosidase 3-like n=1 Tax=Aristolochia californica TaxID=171875 RepID=UPI0035D6FB44
MANLTLSSLLPFLLFFLFAYADAGSIGVNFGRVANDLPTAVKVVQLLKSQGIDRVKLYDTDSSVIRSLSGTGIKVVVALPNELLYAVAKRPSQAYYWVQKNVAAYYPATQIHAIAVGNEVFVSPLNLTNYLVPAMINVQAALVKYKLDEAIKVSSPIALSALQNSYPSSAGAFKSDLVEPVIKPMLDFFRRTGSYLMVNAYPFFAYEGNADVISLDYALFHPNAGVVDSGSGLRYTNLFDAQIDAVFAAMSALKYDDVKLVVTETGWPSKGDEKETGASTSNAAAYNGNLIRHILSGAGTPLRPKADLDVYLFALFNENNKPGPTSERNYGLFYPNEEKVYDIPLTEEAVKREGKPKEKDGGAAVSTSSSGQTWCVANGKVGEKKLKVALDYACGEGGADCRQIQPGANCYDPNTMEAHASYAFNSYYQKKGRGIGTCDFQGAAYVVTQLPKFGKCALPTGESD